METIIAAFISGIATIVAAWISSRDRNPKPVASRAKNKQLEETKGNVDFSGLKPNTAWWTTVMSLFALLLAGTGFFVHHDLPSLMGLFGIPVVVIVLALTKPTKPWSAAAFVFGVSTISFLTEFAVKLTHGQSIRLAPCDRWLPFWILILSAGYAALAAGICWWKRKKQMHS
jgi:hypothetical protein